MKKVFLFMFCALSGFILNAQVSENFSDYTVDGKIAQQAQGMGRDYWTTWSDAPGGAEDGVIAEIGGNKCGKWTWGNDQILSLDGKTTGTWELTCKVYIPAGKRGYFNTLAHFDPTNPSNCIWSLEVYFYKSATSGTPTSPGVGSINAGGTEVKTFNYTEDAWTDVKFVVNLDDDDAELFINNTSIHQWQYTLGASGACPAVLDVMDMYPPDEGAISEFYIDDIVFAAANSTVLYETDFDDVANGAKVAQSYPEWWTTWSLAPGGTEDGTISNEQSSSAPQSAKLVWNNDLVFKAGDQTTGSFTFDFDMYVPNNGIAFFNLLHVFDGSSSEWGVGIYFNIPSGQTMPAGTNVQQNGALTSFTFPFNTWFPISVFVNLDEDIANININGTQVLEWQFSTQESGGAGVNKLAAVDFFPPMDGSIYYIDNIVYTKAGEPLPPPTISIIPDDNLEIKLQPNSIKDGPLYISNEEAGTLKARWSTYIDYSPLETGTGPEFTLALCDPYESPTGGIGSEAEFEREIAMKLTPEDYASQLGGQLKQISYYIMDNDAGGQIFRPSSDLTFRVYAQGPAENIPGEVLAEKVLTMSNFMYSAWNDVDITPVQLTGGEYWISVAMTQEANAHPLTHTSNPLAYNGDWLKTGANGSWGKLSNGSDIKNNWAIVAKGDGKVYNMWGLMDQAYGITDPASESEITVTVNSNGYPNETTMTANIVITTNDPDHPRFDLPLIMLVDSTQLSNNTNVSEVTVDGAIATPTPGGSYDFTISIDINSDVVDIVVTPEHPAATVTGQIGEQSVKAGLNAYEFTVTAEDEITTQEYSLMVMATIVDAIDEIDNSIKLFPNPVTSHLNIQSEYMVEYMYIYDLTGKMVKQVKQPDVSIDLSELSAGYYLLRITTEKGDAMYKFVKE